jgi:hypothetical protein
MNLTLLSVGGISLSSQQIAPVASSEEPRSWSRNVAPALSHAQDEFAFTSTKSGNVCADT